MCPGAKAARTAEEAATEAPAPLSTWTAARWCWLDSPEEAPPSGTQWQYNGAMDTHNQWFGSIAHAGSSPERPRPS